jgi:hypothetical protein
MPVFRLLYFITIMPFAKLKHIFLHNYMRGKFCVYNCSFNTLLPFFNDVDIVLICNGRPSRTHEIMSGLIHMNNIYYELYPQQHANTHLIYIYIYIYIFTYTFTCRQTDDVHTYISWLARCRIYMSICVDSRRGDTRARHAMRIYIL